MSLHYLEICDENLAETHGAIKSIVGTEARRYYRMVDTVHYFRRRYRGGKSS